MLITTERIAEVVCGGVNGNKPGKEEGGERRPGGMGKKGDKLDFCWLNEAVGCEDARMEVLERADRDRGRLN